MNIFSCKNCGDCCKKFGGPGALALFSFEEEIIKKELKKLKIKPNIKPLNIMYDEISKTYFYPQSGMFIEPCPFLDEKNKCKIYEKRPYVCRTFPIIKHPLFYFNKIELNCFTYCPNFNPNEIIKKIEGKTTKEKRNIYKKIFQDANKCSIEANRIIEEIDKKITNLEKEGKIKIRSIYENEEIINPISIFEFLERFN